MGRLTHEQSWAKIASLLAETHKLQTRLTFLARAIDREMRRLEKEIATSQSRAKSAATRLQRAHRREMRLKQALDETDRFLQTSHLRSVIKRSPVPPDRPERSATDELDLPPRLRETLGHLLNGDSEKQVAYKMKLSRNTVHVYITSLYRRSNVNSRSELLVQYLRRGSRPKEVDHEKADHSLEESTSSTAVD